MTRTRTAKHAHFSEQTNKNHRTQTRKTTRKKPQLQKKEVGKHVLFQKKENTIEERQKKRTRTPSPSRRSKTTNYKNILLMEKERKNQKRKTVTMLYSEEKAGKIYKKEATVQKKEKRQR